MLETLLGLRWESFWTMAALRIDIAWEMQTYFEHTSFPVFSNMCKTSQTILCKIDSKCKN